MSGSGDRPDGAISWRELVAETEARLARVGIGGREARWLVEEASGLGSGDELGLDAWATVRGVGRLDDMTARRLAGEPLQYVLGHWSFRSLDLLVDRRVLIPRPETEVVVERALAEVDRRTELGGDPVRVVDLGAGSGAIGLSIAQERVESSVLLVDRSPEALAVARANLAGIGRAATRVTVAEGEWLEPLSAWCEPGSVSVIVANPPYIAADESLPESVRDWEPAEALVAGPTGLEAYESIVMPALEWLAPGGSLVVECASEQAPRIRDDLAVGYASVELFDDLSGACRGVVARRSR